MQNMHNQYRTLWCAPSLPISPPSASTSSTYDTKEVSPLPKLAIPKVPLSPPQKKTTSSFESGTRPANRACTYHTEREKENKKNISPPLHTTMQAKCL